MQADVPSVPARRGVVRRLLRWIFIILGGLVLLVLALALSGWLALRGSLAKLDGACQLPGLTANVVVERDAQGIPTVVASNRLDLARATGFLHAQDRFFQMDLLRRAGAGELCELFGPGPLQYDLWIRQFRLRATAQAVVASLGETERAILASYTEGVNAGLQALAVRPPEYLLLRQKPQLWRPEDTGLVIYRMGLELSDAGAGRDANVAVAQKALSAAAFNFYVRPDTLCQAALDGTTLPVPRLPTPQEFDARSAPTNQQTGTAGKESHPGSNAWAIDGRRTGGRGAMVANDMHLGLALPHIWYRMRFVWHDNDGGARQLVGVSLPGVPAMVVGSNGRVAWGFTAAQLDVSDQVLLEEDAAHPQACRADDAWTPLRTYTEAIRIGGSSNYNAQVTWSPWGPVGTNLLGQRVAYRWVMEFPEAANFGLIAFERASTARELLDLAPRCGLPWQNVIVADRDGHIGWTLGGWFPKRAGVDGRTPASWADGKSGWRGWVAPEDYPRVFDPPQGAVWSANQRHLGSEAYLSLMGGDYLDHGARARQIRDQLLTLTNARPPDLLAIQLDDRAVLLQPWQELMLKTLDSATNEARFAEARQLVANWGGRAATNSVGYRLVRGFRDQVIGALIEPAVQRCRSACSKFEYLPGHHEGLAWDLLKDRPAHLLPLPFISYEQLLVTAARRLLERLPQSRALAEYTWGDQNRVKLRHPLGRAVPQLSRWVDLPERQLPGDGNMPRVQGSDLGASERMVVSPGHEEEGLLHMPGGQSGHFLSPFYGAGHRDWEEGRPTPLLLGATKHRLQLKP